MQSLSLLIFSAKTFLFLLGQSFSSEPSKQSACIPSHRSLLSMQRPEVLHLNCTSVHKPCCASREKESKYNIMNKM